MKKHTKKEQLKLFSIFLTNNLATKYKRIKLILWLTFCKLIKWWNCANISGKSMSKNKFLKACAFCYTQQQQQLQITNNKYKLQICVRPFNN